MKKIPKWIVMLPEGGHFEIEGYLEYLRFGAIQFVNVDNDVIRLMSHGNWSSVMRKQE